MFEALLTYIQQNPEYAVFAVFLIAFGESLAVVGLLVPGWLILVGVGTMIGADVLPFYPIAISAYLGAVMGEYLSFKLGWHYHERILAFELVKKHQNMVDASHRFFEKYGVIGVFLGRFFGPTRAFVPFLAGISEMNQRTFLWVNLISGILWSPLYIIPGILVGATFSLDKEQSYPMTLIIALISIAGVICFRYLKKCWKTLGQESENVSNNRLMILIKGALSLSIFITTIAIFYRSEYWELFVNILAIVAIKL